MNDLPCTHCGQEASRVYFYRKAYAPHACLTAEDPKLCCDSCWRRVWANHTDPLGELYPSRGGKEYVQTWTFEHIGRWSRKQLGYFTSRKFSEFNHFHLSEQWAKRLWHIHYAMQPAKTAACPS